MREDTTLIPRCDLKSLFRSTDGGKGWGGGGGCEMPSAPSALSRISSPS